MLWLLDNSLLLDNMTLSLKEESVKCLFGIAEYYSSSGFRACSPYLGRVSRGTVHILLHA